MSKSRTIPEYIRREVRQRDGFGCVLCRKMPCEYHHIKPFAEGGEHTVENLVLLCPNCHEDVPRSDPLKLRRARDMLKKPPARYHFNSRPLEELIIGSHSIRVRSPQQTNIISFGIGRQFGFRTQSGLPLFSFLIPDWNGRRSFVIEENCFLSATNGPWDLKMQGSRLIIHAERRERIASLRFEEGVLTVEELTLYCDKIAVQIDCNGIRYIFSDEQIGERGCYLLGNVLDLGGSTGVSVVASEKEGGPTIFRIPAATGEINLAQAKKWWRR